MKKLLTALFVTLIVTSCTNRNVLQEKQDSLEAAAAADSMLNEVNKYDTTETDNVAVDTSDSDGL